MTHDKLSALRDKALAMSKRSNLSLGYRINLALIASDCDWAMEGCPHSLASVEAFVAGDHELDLAAHNAAERVHTSARKAA